MKNYFTFTSSHANTGHYVEIEAEDLMECRNAMNDLYGQQGWDAQYSSTSLIPESERNCLRSIKLPSENAMRIRVENMADDELTEYIHTLYSMDMTDQKFEAMPRNKQKEFFLVCIEKLNRNFVKMTELLKDQRPIYLSFENGIYTLTFFKEKKREFNTYQELRDFIAAFAELSAPILNMYEQK